MVYVFLADGFEEIEALTSVDVLRRSGIVVRTVGVTGLCATGSHGIPVKADISSADAVCEMQKGSMPEMIVLPGGMPGAAHLDASTDVDTCIDLAGRAGAFMAAICAAPMILGKRGLLSGKHAVCFPGFENYLTGAKISSDPVVRDGTMITGKAMGAALPFALELVAALKGESAAERIRAEILA